MISIEDKALCTGCAACMNICPVDCISMIRDSYGCEYPLANARRCIQCDKCVDVCPIINPYVETPKPQRAFLAQHNDDAVLQQSTSGGAFSALARAVLESGGVVYGHGYDESTCAPRGYVYEVRCCCANSDDELYRFRNSKYTQSEIGFAYRQVKDDLLNGKRVLFSGTPCQCEGLVKYLEKPYSNLLLVDVVCRAVPSRAVLSAYYQWLERKFGKRPSVIRFRDKSYYGYRYSQIRAFESGSASDFYHAGVESDPMLRAFFSNICDRPSCYSCKFKKRYRVSDVTLWDCFNPAQFVKSFDNNKGATRLLAHSQKGQSAVEEASAYARIEEIDVERAVSETREIVHPVQWNNDREKFMNDLVVMSGYDLMEKWFPDTLKVRFERLARSAARNLGIYDQAKKIAKKLLRK